MRFRGPAESINSATGWSGNYWSSTENNSNNAYNLNVNSSNANVNNNNKTNSNNVVCYR
ncbi:hypothetical protein IJH02_02410 [Candidatus Saccharibacteria bacterium]|nr:hypothetical protein [Candidatus Saccharibacteria bacterium]